MFQTQVAYQLHRRVVGKCFYLAVELRAPQPEFGGDELYVQLAVAHIGIEYLQEAVVEIAVDVGALGGEPPALGAVAAPGLGLRHRGQTVDTACGIEHTASVGYQIAAARQQQVAVERFGHIAVGAVFVAGQTLLVESAGREHQHRYMRCGYLRFQMPQTLKAIHHGHHHIAHHQVGHIFQRHPQAVGSVCCRKHLIIGRECLTQQFQQVAVVFNHQHYGFAFGVICHVVLQRVEFGVNRIGVNKCAGY